MKHLIAIIILALFVGCVPIESDPVMVTQAFSYTAVGDDGIDGQADIIQIRMSLDQDSLLSHWNNCSVILEAPSPPPLTKDTVSAQFNVDIGSEYFFAIKTVDDWGNWSGPSNIVTIIFPDTIAPLAIGDFDAVN